MQRAAPSSASPMTPRVNIQRLWAIREALTRPIAFVAKDGFSRLTSLKGLEALALGLLDEALEMRPGGALGKRLRALHDLFSGFEDLPLEEKKARITRAADLLGPSMEREITEEASRSLRRLFEPISKVRGIGPRALAGLSKKGLNTILDLLFFLPIRYEDRSGARSIRDLASGGGAGQVAASVAVAGEARYGRRRVFEVVVDDGTGLLHLKWFNYRLPYMKRYTPGRRVLVHGTVTRSRYGSGLQMIHPEVVFLKDGETPETAPEGIVPVYSEIEGIHQKTLRKIMAGVVREYGPLAPGGAPPAVLAALGLRDLPSALMEAHFPESMPQEGNGAGRAGPGGGGALARGPAMRSLAFDELFMLETAVLGRRDKERRTPGLRSYDGAERAGSLEARLREALPFRLTRAQERALREIKRDMAGAAPMNRLLEGDVGSGKTLVCLMAALLAVDSGHQAAIMAPTAVLAEQHYSTISGLVQGLGVRTAILTGGLSARVRRERLLAISEGSVDIVVGTHALIQEDVAFRDLALVIVDEQHRFGVMQRAGLRAKGMSGSGRGGAASGEGAEGRGSGLPSPDVLIMTATPIPRTLSMTLFGDLEVSVLDELPPGRTPVKTMILREKERARAYELIRREAAAGAQAYIVYPLVDESEELDLRDATNEKARLEKEIFPGLRLGLLHGRMSGAEKDDVMRAFKEREIDVLVSTTVIEVGLDVPNATVMCIEHAERFGLSQLHQLRGRVGRGQRRSYCLLMAGAFVADEAFRRLRVMERTTDGFQIAEEDLKIRGPGDYLGQRQSGFADFRFGWALLDHGLVREARKAATALLKEHPGLGTGPGPWIREALRARWKGRLELADVG